MHSNLSSVSTLALVVALAGCGGPDKKDEKAAAKGDGACACGTAKPVKTEGACVCADLKVKKTGWCDHCGAGLVDGKPTACEKCAKAGKLCGTCVDGKACTDCGKKG